jgi:hypothetical protein
MLVSVMCVCMSQPYPQTRILLQRTMRTPNNLIWPVWPDKPL